MIYDIPFPENTNQEFFLNLNPDWITPAPNGPLEFPPNQFYKPVRVDPDGIVITATPFQRFNESGTMRIPWCDLVPNFRAIQIKT